MANFITGIIGLTVGSVILASVFITQVKNNTGCQSGLTATENMSGCWTGSEIAMWGLLTLIGIVGMLYGVLNVFGLA